LAGTHGGKDTNCFFICNGLTTVSFKKEKRNVPVLGMYRTKYVLQTARSALGKHFTRRQPLIPLSFPSVDGIGAWRAPARPAMIYDVRIL
jgi:hypothetical protein